MYKQIMFAIAAALLLTAVVTVASGVFNPAAVHAQAPPPPSKNMTSGNATSGNATSGGNATK